LRTGADAELLEALAHIRTENSSLKAQLGRREAVASGDESAQAAAISELEAMLAESEGLTPVLQDQVALLKRALAAKTEDALQLLSRAESAEARLAQAEGDGDEALQLTAQNAREMGAALREETRRREQLEAEVRLNSILVQFQFNFSSI